MIIGAVMKKAIPKKENSVYSFKEGTKLRDDDIASVLKINTIIHVIGVYSLIRENNDYLRLMVLVKIPEIENERHTYLIIPHPVLVEYTTLSEDDILNHLKPYVIKHRTLGLLEDGVLEIVEINVLNSAAEHIEGQEIIFNSKVIDGNREQEEFF